MNEIALVTNAKVKSKLRQLHVISYLGNLFAMPIRPHNFAIIIGGKFKDIKLISMDLFYSIDFATGYYVMDR